MMNNLFLGLMSGTSMDGIDCALINTDGQTHFEFIDELIMNYPAEFQHQLKQAELQARLGQRDFSELSSLSTQYHIDIVKNILKKNGLHNKALKAIGYHGQTIYHNPRQNISLQLGEPRYMSAKLDIPVIFNFRQDDLKQGGQGAPIAPIFHQLLASKLNFIPAAMVNCGGISNVTLIPSKDSSDLIAYDAGPGNVLIDRVIRQQTSQQMDKNGEFAKQGIVNQNLLSLLYEQSCIINNKNYYEQPPTKSLDSQDFTLPKEIFELSIYDQCKTLAAFTAKIIVDSLQLVESKIKPKHWILSGGGWYHPVIYQEFCQRLMQINPDSKIYKAEELNLHNNSIEAQLMAYLAARKLKELPITFPKTTGVNHPLTGGEIFI